jgi:hypothetical protein
MPAAGAVAATTAIGYLGSFAAPPAIGLLAANSTVSHALLVLVPPAAATALLARPALKTGSVPHNTGRYAVPGRPGDR